MFEDKPRMLNREQRHILLEKVSVALDLTSIRKRSNPLDFYDGMRRLSDCELRVLIHTLERLHAAPEVGYGC